MLWLGWSINLRSHYSSDICKVQKNTCVPMFSLMLTPLSLHTVYIWWKCCVGSHATKVNGNKYDGAGRQTTDYWQPDIFQQHGYYCLNGYIHITWEDQSDCTDWVKCNQHCMLELPKFNQERDHVNWEIICRTDIQISMFEEISRVEPRLTKHI